MNSFELQFEMVDGTIIVNKDYYNTKEQQCKRFRKVCFFVRVPNVFPFSDKQVFSDLDFLGWYTTGDSLSEQEIQIHKQICQINECPIMLQLNPQSRSVDVSSEFPTVNENFYQKKSSFLSNYQLDCTNRSLTLSRGKQQCYSFHLRTHWPLKKPNELALIMWHGCLQTMLAKNLLVRPSFLIKEQFYLKINLAYFKLLNISLLSTVQLKCFIHVLNWFYHIFGTQKRMALNQITKYYARHVR